MNDGLTPSANLFKPQDGTLRQYGLGTLYSQCARADFVAKSLESFFSRKNYPCVAGLQAYHKNEFQVGLYDKLGDGRTWRQLRNDLLFFVAEQARSRSLHLTFFAVFEAQNFSETEFEQALWRELSFLSSKEDQAVDWQQGPTSDPDSKDFRFSLAKKEFFVVGLHPGSSRLARQFPHPTLVFNVFEQFERLQKRGVYEALVQTIRKREKIFQGDVNPMVAAHGEKWEAIQFSGKANPSDWKCPFQHLPKAQKPS